MPHRTDKENAASTAMPDPSPHFFEEVDGGAAAGSMLVIVKMAEVTALSLIPDFRATALMVVVTEIAIAPA